MSDRTCTVEGCDGPLTARLMCGRHYQQWRQSVREAGLPLPPKGRIPRTAPQPCAIDGCEQTARKRGWCETHYSRWQRTGDVGAEIPVADYPPHLPPHASDAECSVGGCAKPVRGGGRGLCGAHYERLRLTGDVRADIPVRALAPPRAPGDQCAVDGCERPPDSRGWCQMHYDRWRKHGDPLSVKVIVGNDRLRIESQIDRTGGPDACHPWTGHQTPQGYGGLVKSAGRTVAAHVAAWELENGPEPAGAELDHECHNRAIRDGSCLPGICAHRLCCNLDHLVLRANKREHAAATPGVAKRRRGKIGKLTEAQVREMRELLKTAKGLQMDEIARRYGVGLTQAYRIKRGDSWGWLSDAA